MFLNFSIGPLLSVGLIFLFFKVLHSTEIQYGVLTTCIGISMLLAPVIVGKKAKSMDIGKLAIQTFFAISIIILLIAVAFTEINSNPIVERIFKGIRPAVVALIAVPVIRMIQREKLHWTGGLIALLSIILVWLLGYSPVWVVLGAIIYGIVKEYLTTKRKQP